MTTEIVRIAIDPYGIQTDHSTASSKSIFKEQNLRSGTILSKELIKLISIFDNNTILKGLTINNIWRSNSNRTLNISLNIGKVFQDNTFIDLQSIPNISIDVFNEYSILSINTTDNYFEISGDHVDEFPSGKIFGIFNSTESSYNHTNWVVSSSELSGGNTIISTVQNLSINNSTGEIVNDNFPDNNSLVGNILLTLKYQYNKNITGNSLEVAPVYITSDYTFYPNFSKNSNKIICGIISITKDLDDFIITPTVYKIDDSPIVFKLYNQEFTNHNKTKVVDMLDGSIIT
ncbi:hypothetical protein K9L16_04340 [Candidatus Pacearchaeota archaeon]|nr:hypothetical protein [Candidatus Pacearchaeota archaeon]